MKVLPVARSPLIQAVCSQAEKIAGADLSVLITGETGTGKELFARAIHRMSTRAKAPFLAVNCGGIAKELVESTLFGHMRGAFTGADSNKRGVFASAEGGIVFLDEIGELPPSAQAALLRVLETKNGDARGRHERSSSEHAHHCRNAPQFGRDGAQWHFSRRPVIPLKCVRDRSAATSFAPRRYPGACGVLCRLRVRASRTRRAVD